ncbi:MAG: hypothetical protein PWQ39_487 [Thermacetogenium sp.]|nr:hypothetical protein [Thermacetogenium sp.]
MVLDETREIKIYYIHISTAEHGELGQMVVINGHLIAADEIYCDGGAPCGFIASNLAAALGAQVVEKNIEVPLEFFRLPHREWLKSKWLKELKLD